MHGPTAHDAAFAPFVALPGALDCGALLLCDHASAALPAEYGDLGLTPDHFERHIAYDIGAAELTRALGAQLKCPALMTTFSRLLIDPNRGGDDPTPTMSSFSPTSTASPSAPDTGAETAAPTAPADDPTGTVETPVPVPSDEADGWTDARASSGFRYCPVKLFGSAATSSGVPVTTIFPPLTRPPGPRSITWSAVLMTSRLCSITTTVLPCSTRRWSTPRASRFHTSPVRRSS